MQKCILQAHLMLSRQSFGRCSSTFYFMETIMLVYCINMRCTTSYWYYMYSMLKYLLYIGIIMNHTYILRFSYCDCFIDQLRRQHCQLRDITMYRDGKPICHHSDVAENRQQQGCKYRHDQSSLLW